MNFTRLLSLFMITAFLLLIGTGPVFAAQTPIITISEDNQTVNDNTSVFVDGSNRYGYLTVNSIDIVLSGTDAEITVQYEVTPWIAFLVFLFGKQDLKNRVLAVVGYPEAGKDSQVVTYSYVDNDRAVITVKNVVVDYGDGSYWYPAHTFGTVIPKLTFVLTPTDSKIFNNTKIMSKGFGYFQ
ncbi:MAG: hypothetical protein Q7J08_02570 [Methanocorpusculum sp.]|uniref:hypothetical protein n=1 Tax=Methanocorpusculum sp. TaxID=2058474 RepID=UPI002715FFB5|nr:hypothetical protein [Methanocorpusculum sp.]MDO9522576.1 hypothetical protein [Methanocorpusculum sp.]